MSRSADCVFKSIAMKKTLTVVLALLLCVLFSGCRGGDPEGPLDVVVGNDKGGEVLDDDGYYSGVVCEQEFFHDGRDETIIYYTVDVGQAQYDRLVSELGGIEGVIDQEVETEIHIYTTVRNLSLGDFVGAEISFKGDFFEADNFNHQRNIVFEIKEIKGVTVTEPAGYEPLDQPDSFLTIMLEPDFVEYGTPCWFNEKEVMTAGNNPGPAIESGFAWAEFEDGSGRHCLCAPVSIDGGRGGVNQFMYVPGYGLPAVTGDLPWINISWTDPDDPDKRIQLTFEVGRNYMAISENALRNVTSWGDADVIETPVSVSEGAEPGTYFVPLYAILNEVDGGVMFDPFGDGTAFIYTGNVIRGYSGFWEVMNDSEYRNDATVKGETISVGNYWWSFQLYPDGTFADMDLYYQDEGGWVRTVMKGKYAFFGRVLALMYETESEYRGDGIENLEPMKEDAPFGNWGAGEGSGIYVRYVEDWNDPEALIIRDFRPLYSKALSGQPEIDF